MRNYQTLRSKNLKAAAVIYRTLKNEKTISRTRLEEVWCDARGWRQSCTHLPENYESTIQFLFDHNLMTTELINGFRIYVATQKCIRTKSFQTATREYVEVKRCDIKKAQEYSKLNDGFFSLKSEGYLIGAKILKLPTNLIDKFSTLYNDTYQSLKENEVSKYAPRYAPPTYVAINYALQELKCIKWVD